MISTMLFKPNNEIKPIDINKVIEQFQYNFEWVVRGGVGYNAGYQDNESFVKFKYPRNEGYVRKPDKQFLRDGNWIVDQFFATTGPKNFEHMDDFIKDILNNGIKNIIMLGGTLLKERENDDGKIKNSYKDFFDYTAKGYKSAAFEIKIIKNKQYLESVHNEISGYQEVAGISGIQLEIIDSTKLETTSTVINVTAIKLDDCRSITIKNNKQAKLFWNLYKNTQKEATLVHCAAGVGRTGHIILMQQILKHYSSILSHVTPENIANEITHLLHSLRRNRPGLVTTRAQFIDAIINADFLFHYALKQGYAHRKDFISPLLNPKSEEKHEETSANNYIWV